MLSTVLVHTTNYYYYCLVIYKINYVIQMCQPLEQKNFCLDKKLLYTNVRNFRDFEIVRKAVRFSQGRFFLFSYSTHVTFTMQKIVRT